MEASPNIRKAYESILNHDFEQAVEWFELAVAEQPDNASYHYRLSISYARNNKFAKALEHAKIACRLDAETEVYALHLAMVRARLLLFEADEQMKSGDAAGWQRAVELLHTAVQLDPLSVEAHLMLSIALEQTGRRQEAVKAVADALKLDPQRAEAVSWMQELLGSSEVHKT